MTAKPSSSIAIDATLRARVDKQLRELFDAAIAQTLVIDPVARDLITAVAEEVIRGGKRLRPTLTYLSHMGTGGTDTQALIKVAASMELVHHFLLIHDDVIDRDYIRHGGPNVAGVYRERFGTRMTAEQASHYAHSYAMLAGDMVHVIAQRAVLEADYDDRRKLAALDHVSHMLLDVLTGELLDVEVALPDAVDASFGRLTAIARYKTATYSFESPLLVGAILAGARQSTLDALTAFGRELGIAYQLVDDILGLYGDESRLGKPVGGDLREGKQTLLMHFAYKQATGDHVNELRSIWGQPKATVEDLMTVRHIVAISGAMAKVEQLASDYHQRAIHNLASAGLTKDAHQKLLTLADSCIHRRS